jgi:hypothetical protein
MHDHLVVIVAPGDVWAQRADVDLEELPQRSLLTRDLGQPSMPVLSDC